MKYKQFESITNATDPTGEISYENYSMLKYDGYWYLVTSVSADTDILIRKTNDFITWTTVHTYGYTNSTNFWCFKLLNNKLHFMFDENDESGDLTLIESTDGSTWNEHTVAVGSDDNYVLDLFYLGSTHYIMLKEETGTTVYIYSYTYAGGTITLTLKDSETVDDTYRWGANGYVEDGKYYFALAKTDSKIYSFDETNMTYEETIISGLSALSPGSHRTQLFKKGINLIIINGASTGVPTTTNISIRKNSQWLEYTFPEFINMSACVSSTYELEYIFIENYTPGTTRIYHIGLNGEMNYIQEHEKNTVFGQDLIGIDGVTFCTVNDAIWQQTTQLSTTTLTINNTLITQKHRQPPICKALSYNDDVTAAQTYLITDDSDNLLYIGIAERPDINIEFEQKITFKSFYENDLERKVNESYTTETASFILQDILEKYAYNIGDYDIDVTVDTYSIDFKNKYVKDVIKWAEMQEYKVFYIEADGICHYNDADEDSLINATDSNILRLVKRTEDTIINQVFLRGGYIDGVQITSEEFEDTPNILNQGVYSDTFSHITDQTELDNLASSILTNAEAFERLEIQILSVGRIQVGETITVDSTTHGISSAQYVVLSSKYNDNGVTTVVCYSGLYFEPPEKTVKTRLESEIEDNRQLANQTADLTAEALMLGSANVTPVPCGFMGFGENQASFAHVASGRVQNDGADDFTVIYELLLPTSLGGLKLYITDVYVDLRDADATNYVDSIPVIGLTNTGLTVIQTFPGDYNSTGTHTLALTATPVDVSSYKRVSVALNNVVATAKNLEINNVLINCYYDT